MKALTFFAIVVTLYTCAVGKIYAGDMKQWAYAEWAPLTYREKCLLVEGMMLGSWVTLNDMAMANFDDPVSVDNIWTYNDPYYGVTSGQIVAAVDRIYAKVENRDVPIMLVVHLRKMWVEGIINGDSGEKVRKRDTEDQPAPMRAG